MKRLLAIAIVALGGAAAAAACSSFDGNASNVADAGGDGSTAPDVSTPPDVSAPVADVDVPDVVVPCTESCASRQCDPDGGCYPLVFVTEAQFHGDFGGDAGIATADRLCNAEAQDAGRNGTFIAWLSSTNTEAISRVTKGAGQNRPVIRGDGLTVASSYNAMVNTNVGQPDPKLENPIQRTAAGATVAAEDNVWTGTLINGSHVTNEMCLEWASSVQGVNGHNGKAGYTDKTWTDQGSQDCSLPLRVYCFEVTP